MNNEELLKEIAIRDDLIHNPSRILKAIMEDIKPNDPIRENYNKVMADLVKRQLKGK